MSKLFDKIDHAWELDQINRAEQEAQSLLTGFELARLENVGRSDLFRIQRSKVGPAVGQFEKLRRASRMKLLKTGQLMQDARWANSQIKACSHCHLDADGRHRLCNQHKDFGIVFKRLKWAGEDNMATRLAQPGRVWGDEDPLEHQGGLNEWESWYNRDKKEGVWPGTHAYTGSQQDVENLRREYGSLDYRGWLQFLLEEEEIPYSEYLKEKERLNA